MKILKLDRRYAHFDSYKYALQFRGTSRRAITFNTERKKYTEVFTKFYGPARLKNPDFVPGTHRWWGEYIDNPQWMFDKKHNRIYYQEESMLSMVLLIVGNDC
jgi:hypothetical protein